MNKEDRKELINGIIFFIIWDGIGVGFFFLAGLVKNPWFQYTFLWSGGIMIILSIVILYKLAELIFS